MSHYLTYIVKWLFVFALINVSGSVSPLAQVPDRPLFGISFSQDISENQILNLVSELDNFGIQVVELQHPVSETLLEQLSEYPVRILIRSTLSFLTSSDLNNPEIIDGFLVPLIREYAGNPAVNGIGLTSFSAPFDSETLTSFQSLLPDSSAVQFYVLNTATQPPLNTIIQTDNLGSEEDGDNFLFEAPFLSQDIPRLSSLSQKQSGLIFFDYYWFEQALQSEAYFQESLLAFVEGNSFLLPETDTEPQATRSQWPIIVLILIWLSLGIHIRTVATYRPLIFRYFTFHRFFVDDIMRYRERSAVSGIFLLVQHAFFTGLVIYILAQYFISDKGLEALFHHLPLLSIFGENYFSLFVISIAISFIIEFLGIIWLYLPSKSMKHFSQTINLYSWVFHLDFLIVSIMLISLITDRSGTFLAIMGIAHFGVWLTGFLLAAYDSSKYLIRGRFSYMMNTFGLHTLINLLLIIGFFYSGYLYDIFHLAVML